MARRPETTSDLLTLFNARVSPRSPYFRQPHSHIRPLELQSVEGSLTDNGNQSLVIMSTEHHNPEHSKEDSQICAEHEPYAHSTTPRRSNRKKSQYSAKLESDSPLLKRSKTNRKVNSVRPIVHSAQSSQTQSVSPMDSFLLAQQHLFVPLLPAKNYVRSLLLSMDEGLHVHPGHSPSAALPPKHIQNGTVLRSSASKSNTGPEPQVQPTGVQGLMKLHQLQGLSFMAWLHANGSPGILGDEMGLGKTLQTLSFLQYLKELKAQSTITLPHLIICPLSVLNTWIAEARKFAPGLKMVQLHGPTAERQAVKNRLKAMNSGSDLPCDCVVTNYETIENERSWFSRTKWSYIILDEGTRIKNADSKLAKSCQNLSSTNRFILTGTPVQNDLKELWALLHWLYPKVFNKNTSEVFSNAFDLSKGTADRTTIQACKDLLDCIMLRRTKNSPGVDMRIPPKREVLLYVPLSQVQRSWYQRLITRAGEDTINDLFLSVGNKEQQAVCDIAGQENSGNHSKTTNQKKVQFQGLLNLLMQLRMLCVHPYLIQGIQPEPYVPGMHIVHASSKFVLLSKLLDTLVLAQKRKVLIFSGFTGVLDLCEDLLHFKGGDGNKFRYLRFDGKTLRARRNLVMRLFQDKNSDYRVMLISIKAGGIGINLQSASEVIFLDEDWNPQIMLQAEARAHRYGQTEEVTVYKICTTGSVEEQMLKRIQKKLYLSTSVVGVMEESDEADGVGSAGLNTTMSMADLRRMIRRGAQTLTQTDDPVEMLDWDMDKILERCRERFGDGLGDELTEEEWLAEAEKIECAVFEGVKLDRGGGSHESGTQPQELRRADRRAGKEMIAIVDGYPVSKESMNCQKWEAVPTLANRNAKLADVDDTEQEEIFNQKHCQICKNDGNLVCCSGCPRAYHDSCLNKASKPKTRMGLWYCPQHSCYICEKATGDAGGLLYRCRDCAKAFCEECLDWDATTERDETLQEFEQLGYGKNATAFYLRCQVCTSHRQSSSYPEPSTPVRQMSDGMDGLGYSPSTSPSRKINRVPSLEHGDSPGSPVEEVDTPKSGGSMALRSLKRKFEE